MNYYNKGTKSDAFYFTAPRTELNCDCACAVPAAITRKQLEDEIERRCIYVVK
jgi:hypothetical protein